jgi:tRNA G46 methylase TrmB
MSTRRVEYNKLAATYNQRFKKSKQDQTSVKLQSLAFDLAAQNILEVGCGTGG